MAKIVIYGTEFRSISDLFKLLGFSRLQAKSYVISTFGSYEKMVQSKLGLTDPAAIEKKLKELQDGGIQKSDSDALSDAVSACLKAAWSRLSDSDRDLIINSTAIALKVSASELSERLKAQLQTQ